MGQEFAINDNQHKDSGFGTIVSDFGQSLFHSAVESPINGVTQLVNDVTGTNIKPLSIVGAPSEPTSTADSYAQKIGGAIGMVIPYFLISKGVGKAAGGLAETSMAKSLSLSPFLESSVARAGLSGAVYGGIFNPVAGEKNHGWARLRNAAIDGATFATLTGTSESLAKFGIFKPGASALANTVKDIGATMIAGVPAGIVSAEGQSLLGQGRLATGGELKQSAMDFVTIGGALAALTHGVTATQGAWRSYRSGAAESTGSVEPVVFKPESPTYRTAAATDAVKARETGLDLPTRPGSLSELSTRLTGYKSTTESMPVAKPGAVANFDSLKQFTSTALEYQDRPVRVYSVEGSTTRIVIPEEYARQLDAVRQYRLGLEGKGTPGKAPLNPELLNRALPEDFISHLDTLPNKDLVQKLYLVNESNPLDAFHQQQSANPNFESQAQSLDNKSVTFFKKNVDASLGDEMRHEWSHQLRWQNQPESSGFDLAAKYEGPKYQPRPRAGDGPEERFAVLMGEQFINPNSSEFLQLTQQAPIQSVFLADALTKTLQSGSLSDVDAAALQARIDHVQNVVKPAVAKQLVTDIRSSENPARTTDAARLLIRMGEGQMLNQAPELTSLDLTREPVGAAALKQIANNRYITDIKLDGTHVGAGGEGLGFLENLPLRSVSLSGTQITGSVLSSLERILTLKDADLSYTNVGPDSGLGSLTRMPQLQKVDLTGSKVTQSGVDWLRQQMPNTQIVY